jgi:DNA-binding transcriptional MerR regulator
MKEYFTIGEISKLFQVKIATLRYYDEIGLLRPEFTDEKTNYRYYSTQQFERLNSIKYRGLY